MVFQIGVNLNPDKVCNFDCIYCQVDRTSQSETRFVEIGRAAGRVGSHAGIGGVGRDLRDRQSFARLRKLLRRLNDIAFAGDGEPTTYKNFDEIIQACASLKKKHALDDVKMVLITNASMFHRPHVQRGLEILDENNGEVWAKLEAGTEDYFKLIDRTPIRFQTILENIANAAQVRPVVIQALFMRVVWRAAAGRRIGCVLPAAQRNHRSKRSHQPWCKSTRLRAVLRRATSRR